MLFDTGRIGRQTATKTHAMTDAGVYTSPTLDLDFTSGVLDSRVTFTRAAGSQSNFDSTGTMVFPGTNVPRFDYDPVTLAPRGLLIEEARTNLALQSSSPGAWTTVAATVIPASIMAPDGTMTGAFLQEDLTNNVHNATAPQTILTATVYSHSCFVKAGTRTVVGLSGAGLFGAGLQAVFNLATGADISTGTHANFSHGIYPVGNGWYRIWVTWTSTNTTGFDVELFIVNRSYPGDGVSGLYIWGAQTEAGGLQTSYIPTTAAAATRANETCATPQTISGFPVTYAFEGMIPVQNAIVAGMYCIDDGSPANRMNLRELAASNILAGAVVFSSGTTGNFNLGSMTPGTTFKAALRYGAADASYCLNGGAVVSGAATPPTAGLLTTLRVGIGQPGSQYLNGYVRRLRFWSRGLSDGELQVAST